MFTGLVEEIGECLWLKKSATSLQLTLLAKRISSRVRTGDSVSINGCCLTVTSHRKEQLVFDLLEETLHRTNLGKLRQGAVVNLERAVRADGRMGGHFVQGHVDCVGTIQSVGKQGSDMKIIVEYPREFARYIAWKGSITVNGVSLTVAELSDTAFSVWIIPHTSSHTNLGGLNAGDVVNLEFDILAKYAERVLAYAENRPTGEQPQ